jgi:D-alanine-D-alanine ligase and related ATP-grasp enzymes
MSKYGRIAILAGGPSNERDISLKSGRAVYGALKRKGLSVSLVELGENYAETVKGIDADIVFLALHGKFGEDGTIQKILEEKGTCYTGSGPGASMLAMDKVASREIFFRNGLKVPGYNVTGKGAKAAKILEDFSPPFIVKPRNGGSSIGLTVVRREEELEGALEKAFCCSEEALIEEYVHGKEITVGIFNERLLPVVEIVTKENFYDYNAKYENADTRYVVPANLDTLL